MPAVPGASNFRQPPKGAFLEARIHLALSPRANWMDACKAPLALCPGLHWPCWPGERHGFSGLLLPGRLWHLSLPVWICVEAVHPTH